MKVFHCDRCNHLLFFENSHCVACGTGLAFVPDLGALVSYPPDMDGTNLTWTPALPGTPAPASGGASHPAANEAKAHRRCKNYVDYQTCNWAVAEEDGHDLCRSCRLTRLIPDVSQVEQRVAWYKLEIAKRRLVFTLLALGLPLLNRDDDPAAGLAFEFKADSPDPNDPKVLTGHAAGIITLNIAEADDAERERRRHGLGEPYRTLLGHMRHESGHYYWDRLIAASPELERFRDLFGDERLDYGAALQRHYDQGPPPDWQARFVSSYASSHAWEDWAETWAHYLHMVDAIETASDNGVALKPKRSDEPAIAKLPRPAAVMSGQVPFERLIDVWFPLTYLLNNLNRSLGLVDGYPFVLSVPALEKLRFVHDLVGRTAPATSPATRVQEASGEEAVGKTVGSVDSAKSA